MNRFRINAMQVKTKSMVKVTLYPLVISKILFDTVAIREPPMTVNVMNAILVEKCFIPKKDEVNAAVMVGQEP